MISASTQALAALMASNPLWVEQETISFDHPQVARDYRPCLNIYCYHIQAIERKFRVTANSRFQANSHFQWFELKFVLSAFDHTTLGEQHMLSTIMSGLSDCRSVPEHLLAPSLKGWGDLPLKVLTLDSEGSLQLWNVLGVPIRLSLQLTLAVPASCSNTLVMA